MFSVEMAKSQRKLEQLEFYYPDKEEEPSDLLEAAESNYILDI